jgi:hypothetical protein
VLRSIIPTILFLTVFFGTSGCEQQSDTQVAGDGLGQPMFWYVQAGATGDGRVRSSPFGSTAQLEAESRPGDIIVVLPAAVPLENGLALKPRQVLLGVRDGTEYPVLTNATEDVNGGNGLVLADGVRVEGIEIRDTIASGIHGMDVGDINVSDVLVTNADIGHVELASLPDVGIPVSITHGGVTILTSQEGRAGSLTLSNIRVLGSAGMGVGAVAVNGSNITLHLVDSEVRDGELVELSLPNDFGVAAVASGDSSTVTLAVINSEVSGRMSPGGRNVILAADGGGAVHGLVSESVVGASGQDGILVSMITLPANIDLTIVGSTIENAAQSNVEGTMSNLPHEEAAAGASHINVLIERSTIRGAGLTPYRTPTHFNVNMTGSFVSSATDQPLPRGLYRLQIMDSVIESSRGYGVRIGTTSVRPTVDPGLFDVLIRGTHFNGNETADLMIGATDARIDARENCWLSPEGKTEARVVTVWPDVGGTVDVSDTVPCE